MFCKFAQLRLETRAFWMSERYPSWASLSPRWRCRFRFGKLLASPNKIQHATRTLYNLEGKLPSGHTNGSRALVNPSGDGNGICLCHRGDLMKDHAQPVLHAVSRCTPVAVRPSRRLPCSRFFSAAVRYGLLNVAHVKSTRYRIQNGCGIFHRVAYAMTKPRANHSISIFRHKQRALSILKAILATLACIASHWQSHAWRGCAE